MGFGVLFIGYFLFLNFAYPEYTDAVAAAIMLYGLYKLSGINKGFKLASFAAMAVTALGAFELGVEIYKMFSPYTDLATLYTVTAIIRHFLSCVMIVLMLIGMRDVSREVRLGDHARKCNYLTYATLVIYVFNVMLEATGLGNIFAPKVLAVMAVASILATLVITIVNLGAVYTCYMKICMPGEERMERKKSKIAIFESFRRHEEEKQREYAQYKLEKFKQKMNKRKKK